MSPRRRSTAVIDGVVIAYEERGEGPPIVFVHGLAVSSYSWREVARALSRSHRTICVDLMGFGFSAKPRDEPYTLGRQASLLYDLMAELDLRGAALIGHSYGGGVCLSLMRHCVGLDVAGLILVGSMCYRMKLPWSLRLLRTPVFGRLCAELTPAGFCMKFALRKAYYRDDRLSSETVAHYAERLRSPGARAALIAAARQIVPGNADDLIASYQQISVPSLVVWGRHDAVIPLEHGERLAREIPDAELTVIEDCGHSPQEERPERTAEVIGDFLRQLS
jgi:pimeloyl-ACP methyl ester carboxylesterase